jgi:hypothetical protein
MHLIVRLPRRPSFAARASRACRSGVGALAVLFLLVAGQGARLSAEQSDRADLTEWTHRLNEAIKRHDAAEEVLCLTTIQHQWPWAFSSLPRSVVERALADADDVALGAPRIELLQILYERRWKRADGTEPSVWWRELSLALLERNQPDEAVAVAAHITDPYQLVAIRADNRYRPITKSDLVEHDVRKATEKQLDWWREAAAREPRNLSRVIGVGRQLLLLHRYDEALKLAEAAQKRLASPAAYDDQERQSPWLAELRASALFALGRHQEAVAVLRGTCNESSPDAISHCLNLADALVELNLPHEALAAIPDLKKASKYGHAVATLLQVMAASELGDSATMDSALAELRAQPASRRELLKGLVVTGRLDEAAQVLVTRLADPDLRCHTLLDLQDFHEFPAPEQLQKWRAQLRQLRARPDVTEAIKSHGRIDAYSLPGLLF